MVMRRRRIALPGVARGDQPWEDYEVVPRPATRTPEQRARDLKVERLKSAWIIDAERQVHLAAVLDAERHWHNVVRQLRGAGASWAEIGSTCGLVANSARMRFQKFGQGTAVDPVWVRKNVVERDGDPS